MKFRFTDYPFTSLRSARHSHFQHARNPLRKDPVRARERVLPNPPVDPIRPPQKGPLEKLFVRVRRLDIWQLLNFIKRCAAKYRDFMADSRKWEKEIKAAGVPLTIEDYPDLPRLNYLQAAVKLGAQEVLRRRIGGIFRRKVATT